MCQVQITEENTKTWSNLQKDKDQLDVIDYIWQWSLLKGYKPGSAVLNFLLYKFRKEPDFILNIYNIIISGQWSSALCEEYEENGIHINRGINNG